jgi:hypothetical protein
LWCQQLYCIHWYSTVSGLDLCSSHFIVMSCKVRSKIKSSFLPISIFNNEMCYPINESLPISYNVKWCAWKLRETVFLCNILHSWSHGSRKIGRNEKTYTHTKSTHEAFYVSEWFELVVLNITYTISTHVFQVLCTYHN